jgi:very-short-patch-repair endonuclease/predicted transcriptional regulator of viral defense system
MPEERRIHPGERGENVAHPDATLARLAAAQHGVVARRQLLATGIASSMIDRRVASGHLVPLHRGVFAVGHARLHRNGYWVAAVLAAGPGAVLSHRDAAALHGLRPPGDRARYEVTTTGRATSTPKVRVHRTTTLGADDVTTAAGIPTTTVARTLVDLAGVVQAHQLAKALNEAEWQHRVDVRAIEQALARTAGRHGHGHAAMRAALASLQDAGIQLTLSELEDRFLALLDAYDLPRPRTNHLVGGMSVDACWPDCGVAVELDGYASHSTRQAFERDRDRTNRLQMRGWLALRFTHRQIVAHPEAVARTVAQALRRGPAR